MRGDGCEQRAPTLASWARSPRGQGRLKYGFTGLVSPLKKPPKRFYSNVAVPWNGAGTSGLAGFVLNRLKMLHCSNSVTYSGVLF